MAITLIWNDGQTPLSSFTMGDDDVTAIDLFRNSILDSQTGLPKYPDIKTMLVSVMLREVVIPARTAFPSQAVVDALTAVEVSKAAAMAVLTSNAPGFQP